MRTAINVAYRMTFLSHALVTGATDLPSLLIIDSPRKNVGYGNEDQQLIARLYAHFLDHIAGARRDTPHARPHQVIIVDNDLPSPARAAAPPDAHHRAHSGRPAGALIRTTRSQWGWTSPSGMWPRRCARVRRPDGLRRPPAAVRPLSTLEDRRPPQESYANYP